MQDWVWNIFIMIAALSFIEMVLPEGGMQKYLKFIFSLMILGIIVYPLSDFKFENITTYTRPATEQSDGTVGNALLNRIINVQTKQIKDVYQNKVDAMKEDAGSVENEGISIPWTDIYSNNGEE